MNLFFLLFLATFNRQKMSIMIKGKKYAWSILLFLALPLLSLADKQYGKRVPRPIPIAAVKPVCNNERQLTLRENTCWIQIREATSSRRTIVVIEKNGLWTGRMYRQDLQMGVSGMGYYKGR